MAAVRFFAAALSASLILQANSQPGIGDDCRTADGHAGTCKDPDASECHNWLRQQIREGSSPGICSFVNHKPIVCCSNRVVGGRLGILTEESRRSKSYRKCQEYSEAFNELEQVPVLTPTTISVNSTECSIRMDGTQLIIGGTITMHNEFPHMAALGFGQEDNVKYLCGGSLISERYVLTAAHCLFDRVHGLVTWARLGDLNIGDANDDADAQMMAVERRYAHPNYTVKSHYNDIALLELEDDVELTKAVRPACIHHLEDDTSEDLIALVTGWGKTSDWSSTSDKLMKAQLKFVSNAKCRKSYTGLAGTSKLLNNIDDNIMVCAGDPKGEKDTCQGDSGGPIQLVLHEPTCMYVVVGLTSFGPSKCEGGKTPAVYTRIQAYLPWIESQVWPD